jgi:hypothetical protein
MEKTLMTEHEKNQIMITVAAAIVVALAIWVTH